MGELCIVIRGPSVEEAASDILEGNDLADLFEFRLDLFETASEGFVKRLFQLAKLPVIFKLKDSTQLFLLALGPQYVDIDFQESSVLFDRVYREFPKVKVICSYHNFEVTPSNLEEILEEMKHKKAFIYKLATYATTPIDSLKMALFVKKQTHVLGLCMGDHGQLTRILAPVMGSPWSYAPLKQQSATAAGQLTATELINTYRYFELNQKSLPFALLGGELVSKSIGHIIHNHTLKRLDITGVYVKIALQKNDAARFLELAHLFGFQGFSVTMPLKEIVLPSQGAINTLTRTKLKYSGANSDGIGALNAIEKHGLVKGKKMVILGAGGAAKACAYEALHRGAKVTLLNRDISRAKNVAQAIGCGFGSLEECERYAYHILVQATPVGMKNENELLVPAHYLRSDTVVLDMIVRPKVTAFLREAKKRGALTIEGEKMFLNQAACQYEHWFENQLDKEKVFRYVEESLCC